MAFRAGPLILQLSKKRFHSGNGKEDSVKETQEGCLSRPINRFFERFSVQKIAGSLAKRLFAKLTFSFKKKYD